MKRSRRPFSARTPSPPLRRSEEFVTTRTPSVTLASTKTQEPKKSYPLHWGGSSVESPFPASMTGIATSAANIPTDRRAYIYAQESGCRDESICFRRHGGCGRRRELGSGDARQIRLHARSGLDDRGSERCDRRCV